MRKLTLHSFFFALFALVAFGCAQPVQSPLPVGNLKLGVAFFTYPADNSELIAGYIAGTDEVVNPAVLGQLDLLFAESLQNNSKHIFTNSSVAFNCSQSIAKASTAPRAALHRWGEVGRCMNVDLLLVPQVYEWKPRHGGSAGVVTPARIALGFFLIDARNDRLISRFHFDETQQALSDNLLEAGKFFKRGARWITAEEMAVEAMNQAIKELRL